MKKTLVPVWIQVLGSVAIHVELMTYGYHVMETLGNKITYMSLSWFLCRNGHFDYYSDLLQAPAPCVFRPLCHWFYRLDRSLVWRWLQFLELQGAPHCLWRLGPHSPSQRSHLWPCLCLCRQISFHINPRSSDS